MSPIAIIVGCILIGYLLLFVELFFPGGIVGLLGGILILAGVVICWQKYGMAYALPLAIACSFGGLAFFILWAKYFPTSRMGQQFNLSAAVSKEKGYTAQDPGLVSLIGKRGVAQTELRPSGIAVVDGKRLDVISEGGFVSKGTSVAISEVASNRIVVRPCEDSTETTA